MNKPISRRSAFKLMGMGALGMPITEAKAEVKVPDEAFRFFCHCSRQLVAKVPPHIGDTVNIDCACRVRWELTWKGDHFSTMEHFPNQPLRGRI